jgi:hypothetical protein
LEGLTGRLAGGPDFCINVRDNTAVRGPGGKGDQADLCFAKVIVGFEEVDRMHKKSSVIVGKHAEQMQDNIAICSIRVLSDYTYDQI